MFRRVQQQKSAFEKAPSVRCDPARSRDRTFYEIINGYKKAKEQVDKRSVCERATARNRRSIMPNLHQPLTW